MLNCLKLLKPSNSFYRKLQDVEHMFAQECAPISEGFVNTEKENILTFQRLFVPTHFKPELWEILIEVLAL